jgi:hypothetical protein
VELDQNLSPELKLQSPDRLRPTVHPPEVRKPADATLADLLTLVVEPSHQGVAAEHQTRQPVTGGEGLVMFLEAASVVSVADKAVQVFEHRHPALDVSVEVQTGYQQLVEGYPQPLRHA